MAESHTDNRQRSRRALPLVPLRIAVLVMLAIAVSGYLAGWLTGLSESPVAGILLPLLFTLIAGAGGFHFATATTGKAERSRIGYSAAATLVFMGACWVGIHFGIRARIGPPATDEAAAWSPAGVDGLPAIDVVRLSGISRKLHLLGVKAEVIRTFQTRYIAEALAGYPPGGSPSPADLDELESALKLVAAETANAEGPRPSVAVRRFRDNLPNYLGHLRTLRRLAAASGRHVPVEHYRTFLSAIDKDNSAIIDHREGNLEGRVLTPAPSMNYLHFYALQMVIATQEEPIENESRARVAEIGEDEMTLLDTAIRLARGEVSVPAPELAAANRRYAVKR